MKTLSIVAVVVALVAITATPSRARAEAVGTPQVRVQETFDRLIANPANPLPLGTKVYSVTLENGLAKIDFSRQLKDNFKGGDTDEALIVTTIARTAGEFPAIRQFEILVNGQVIDSIGGLIDTSTPLPVVRPSQAPSHE